MEERLSHEIFTSHLNTKFQVVIDDTRTLDLELVEVSALKSLPHQREFAVVFRGPDEFFLGQGIRSFTQPDMGNFEIFIVPIRQDPQGFYYEAVFNWTKLADSSPKE